MTGPSLSVAMCTYNGAAYLEAQLASLATQTRPPDELVVCDDGSTDGTVALLEGFGATAGFPVRIHLNEHRLGSTKNFEQAIGRCTSEILALCDQDDEWAAEKLARTEQVLVDRPEVGLVCSDAEIMDHDLNPVGARMSQRLGFGAADKARVASGGALDVLVRTNFVTGTTMAFRSAFIPDIVPIPPSWIHDGWIGLVVALRSKIAYIDEPLVHYRQHATNLVGAPARPGLTSLAGGALPASAGHLRREAEKWRDARARASTLAGGSELALLAGKEQHMRARAGLPSSRLARVAPVLRELVRGNYGRYSAGPPSAVKDLVVGA